MTLATCRGCLDLHLARTRVELDMSAIDTLATSQEIRDRGSTFVGCIYRANSVDEARKFARRRHQRQGQAGTHVDSDTRSRDGDGDAYAIAAWRVMVVKPGKTGLGGSNDFEVGEGWEDGGERWAGKRVLGVMQREAVVDAVVVVHRWFGGTLLGPIRFTHVETCASEVCRRFRKMEEMEECVEKLHRLDEQLEHTRTQLAHDPNTDQNRTLGKKRKAPDCRSMQEALDFTKAKRLIRARECEIENTRQLMYSESRENRIQTT